MRTNFSTLGCLESMAKQIAKKSAAEIKPVTQVHNASTGKINGSQVNKFKADHFVSLRARNK
jgi:hypothetical protein